MYDHDMNENYAALNDKQWNSTRNCGRCAQVSCDDPRCSDTTTTEIVYIVDRCLECKEGDLDLSTTVFQKVTGSRDSSRYNIKWKYVDCPVNGNIQYCTKSGSSKSWLAIQPTNFLNGVANMKIAHQSVTMVESCYYFLLDGGSNVDMSAVPIELTSIAGETISETLNLSSNHCTEGMSNFGSQNTKSMQLMPVSSDTSSSSKPYDLFYSTKSNNDKDTFKVGTVLAANESGSNVSILQSKEEEIENTSNTKETDQDEKLETKYVTNKAEEISSSTSPVLMALIIAAAVACIALAVVALSVKKKNIIHKRVDQDDGWGQAFDTFNSPVRITERIAKL
ncbi:RlpA-like double-psi beta-barrel domain [Plasmopara halstedii]|uniref:RlpA-like double-psi beta-barrel domain n=1 Tax=Plasmopara halstedii TaxID=4781 RepID=A0A0P1AKZ6_PLAHL|nr:RlpA-like double-psi beta-barrel domain [Plasmopara halstedii]CEG41965.1 RlpA-like double-psi beta-barrel domain [Plasmopara halstedii]|eukprot:XP_024578334.1 RlpA-like double-psi beta-barrel domain [Plasmopara halstedii]